MRLLVIISLLVSVSAHAGPVKINRFKVLNDKIESLSDKIDTQNRRIEALLSSIEAENQSRSRMRSALNAKSACYKRCDDSWPVDSTVPFEETSRGQCFKTCERYNADIPIEVRWNE